MRKRDREVWKNGATREDKVRILNLSKLNYHDSNILLVRFRWDVDECRWFVDIWRGRESATSSSNLKRKSNHSWPINKSDRLNSQRVSQRLALFDGQGWSPSRNYMPTTIGVFAVLSIHSRRDGICVETSQRDVLSIMARIFEVDDPSIPSRFKDVLIMSFHYLTTRIREKSLQALIGLIILILYTHLNTIIL